MTVLDIISRVQPASFVIRLPQTVGITVVVAFLLSKKIDGS
jgi:hypothetical protein